MFVFASGSEALMKTLPFRGVQLAICRISNFCKSFTATIFCSMSENSLPMQPRGPEAKGMYEKGWGGPFSHLSGTKDAASGPQVCGSMCRAKMSTAIGVPFLTFHLPPSIMSSWNAMRWKPLAGGKRRNVSFRHQSKYFSSRRWCSCTSPSPTICRISSASFASTCGFATMNTMNEDMAAAVESCPAKRKVKIWLRMFSSLKLKPFSPCNMRSRRSGFLPEEHVSLLMRFWMMSSMIPFSADTAFIIRAFVRKQKDQSCGGKSTRSKRASMAAWNATGNGCASCESKELKRVPMLHTAIVSSAILTM
mmetsp:Transcript_168537/g.541687  ORF Transcript_168537/g.541687 Transcript_168537/m.541687 type:complete len:307 (+) Transcript_168537:264-1184(+)